MSIFSPEQLQEAHKRSIFHQQEILSSSICGCFYCLSNFAPDEIVEWVDSENPRGKTALCPKCAIDSVIGLSSGFPVDDKDFLNSMRKFYF